MRIQPVAILILAVCAMQTYGSVAKATPILQLYVDGGAYDASLQTWTSAPGSSGFDIWVIADIGNNQGDTIPVLDVALVATLYDYNGTPTTVSIEAIQSTLTNSSGLIDNFETADPFNLTLVGSQLFKDDSSEYGADPTVGGVMTHSEFAGSDNHVWWGLGDFDTKTDNLYNFDDSLDLDNPIKTGRTQINVYRVTLGGDFSEGSTAGVHFDVFDHVEGANHVFAPFSHDASGSGTPPTDSPIPAPEPSSLLLAAFGVLGFSRVARRRNKGDHVS